MSEIIIITGKILDSSNSNIIPGVKVSQGKYFTNTDGNGVFTFIINIPITVSTSDNSFIQTSNSFTEIQSNPEYIKLSKDQKQYIRDQLTLTFYQKNYSQNTEIFPFNNKGEWILDLGIIQLTPQNQQLDSDKVESQLSTDQENQILKDKINKDNIKAGASAQLQTSLNKFILKIKNTLIPLLLLLLSEFGVTLAMVNKNKFLDKKQCPTNEKLLQIISRRNKIVTQLNNLYSFLNTVSQSTTLLTGFLEVLQLSITIAKAVPAPAPAGVAAILISLENKLGKIIHVIAGISFTSLIAAATLKQIISLISALDSLIQQCSIDNNVSLVAINNDILNASNLANEAIYNGNIEYKGFTLGIQEDTKDNNKYVKRYAIARDVRGNIVLRGESSFSASTQILIDELKFQIDQQDLKAF